MIRIAVALWAIGVLSGAALLMNYQSAPGSAGTVNPDWPAGVSIQHDSRRCLLLMFVHPRCPCSRASIAELAKVMAGTENRVDARVIFVRPLSAPPGWEVGANWRDAGEIPGTQLMLDVGGALTRRFHVETSGHTLLFDPSNKLIFEGGITSGRGHEGDNTGAAAIRAALLGSSPATSSTPVFGCQLLDPDDFPDARSPTKGPA